jgi:non-specific serine/threonine protein kinase
VELYAGPLLEGCPEEWAFQERREREEAYLAALERLAGEAQARGDTAAAERYLRRAAAVDPLRESAQRALMQALSEGGSYAAALEVYRELRLRLYRELNAQPDPETAALFERIRSQAQQRAAAPRPSASTLPKPRHNLPAPLTRFIGREREIRDVCGLLDAARLVTLTGTGGCGKSRLSLEVARQCAESFDEGAWLIQLAALTDPALILRSIATTLHTQEQPGVPLLDTLIDRLRRSHLLLLLDNCEHLLTPLAGPRSPSGAAQPGAPEIGDCAELVERLLEACPELRILATSRQPLGISGEHQYYVPSLTLPPASSDAPLADLLESEAVRLFVDRALQGTRSFALTLQNAVPVAQICRRLDGIPLAIELAAARVRALPVEALSARLDDRFALLTGGSRTTLPRHRTLRATMDWSYHLLSEPEQALLRRLSVFAGGWTLEAAEAVCSGDGIRALTTWDMLARLVEKSLVVYREREGEARYGLLETARQYAAELLAAGGEVTAARRRHAQCFLALAETAKTAHGEVRQRECLDQLESEHDNLRAALEWSVETGEAETGLRLGLALIPFWWQKGYLAEGRKQLGRLLAMSQAEKFSQMRAEALLLAGDWAQAQSDYGAASAFLEKALAAWHERGESALVARCYHDLGLVAREKGDYARARPLYEQGLAIRRELGDQQGIAWSLNDLGYVAFLQGDLPTARSLLEQSLAIARRCGYTAIIAWSLTHLAQAADAQGDFPATKAPLSEVLAIWRADSNPWGIAWTLLKQGRMAQHQGDWPAALACFTESLSFFHECASGRNVAECLEGTAVVAVAQGQPDRAVRLFGAAEAVREAGGWSLPPVYRSDHEEAVAALRAEVGQAAFAAAWAEGRAMLLDQTVTYALQGSDPEF